MKTALLFIAAILLIGCGKEIKDFVRGGQKPPVSPGVPLPPSYQGADVKVSPGAQKAYGGQVSAQFAVSTNERSVAGSRVAARISFSRSRK